jgi:proteasome lid subunit RPN8/RPN11
MNIIDLHSPDPPPPRSDIEEIVEDVRRVLREEGRGQTIKYKITLPRETVLCLIISPKWRKAWRFELDTNRSQGLPGQWVIKPKKFKEESLDGLRGWLQNVFQPPGGHGNSESAHGDQTGSSETQVVRVSNPSESAGPRIRVLTGSEATQPVAAAVATPKIKVKEATGDAARPGTLVISEGARVEERRDDRSRKCTLIEQTMGYLLASGDVVKATFPQAVSNKLIEHCNESLQHGREVGGLLIGKKEQTEEGGKKLYQVRVTDLIRFRAADSSGAHLHLNQDSWAYVFQKESEAGYEAEKKVRLGWYHTHPTQGIFFSAKDHNFHEVFDQPHQFALVVDPRNMEAGLFYWDNEGRTSLTGPLPLKLPRDSEPRGPADSTYEEPPHGAERVSQIGRGTLAVWRLTAGLIVALVALWVTLFNSTGYLFRPDHLSLLALVVALEFRLWNMGWFHPDEPVESALATRVAQTAEVTARVGGRTLVGGLKRVPAKAYKFALATLLLVGLLAFVVRWSGPVVRQTLSVKPSPQAQGTEGHAETRAGEAHPSEATIIVKEEFVGGRERLILESEDKGARVEYIRRVGDDSWTCDDKSEAEFFRKLFQWEINGGRQRYLEDFQIKLARDDVRVTGGYDGRWGGTTRKNFLRKALDLSESGRALEVPSPADRPVRVVFTRKTFSNDL